MQTKRIYYVRSKTLFSNGVYANRTPGGHCHHCPIIGHINALTTTGEETSTGSNLPGEPAPMDTYLDDVHLR